METKLKFFLLLPFIRFVDGITVGEYAFSAYYDLVKESPENRSELMRIISFFRQREVRLIDAFNYLILEGSQEELNKQFLKLRRSLEIYRYLTVDPENKGLSADHTTPYLVFPMPNNPRIHNNEEFYMYRINEGFEGKESFASYPHASQRPLFYKDIYGEDPPHIDIMLATKLFDNVTDKDLQAITWYNKTFTRTAQDNKENMLRLSVAYETHFTLDEGVGKSEVIAKISEILTKSQIKEPELSKILKELAPYTTSMIVKRLAEAVETVTSSTAIKKWFKTHFYSIGSGIRHGDNVSDLPKPVISKNKQGLSIWYAGEASHEYLNNVYFGQRLFKFLLEEAYSPHDILIKKLYVETLEALLVSDEERLKELEEVLTKKKIGELTSQDIRIAFSFKGTYYGSKLRILLLLKRILKEIKAKQDLWKEISTQGEIILTTTLSEEELNDYKKTKSLYYAIIDIDSILHNKKTSSVIDEKEMMAFYIRDFISYAMYKLV